MIAVSGDEAAVDSLGEQIGALREERQSVLAEAAERSDLQERMNDMIAFLDEMPILLTEYSDAITRRLVEKITIYDEKIVVELKSGLQMEVEAYTEYGYEKIPGTDLHRRLRYFVVRSD